MRSATADVKLTATASYSNRLLQSLGNAKSTIGGSIIRQKFTSGVEANKVNRVYYARGITLSAMSIVFPIPGVDDGSVSGYTDYDITRFGNLDIGAGLGNDAVGMPIDFDEIVLLYIGNAGPGDLIIQPSKPAAADIPWMQTSMGTLGFESNIVKPDGFKLWYAPGEQGLEVENGSSSALRLGCWDSGEGSTCVAEILILARSDDALDLTAVAGGSVTMEFRIGTDNKIILQNTTGATISMASLVLSSALGYLVPIPPGDLTAPASPFSFLLSNTVNTITYGTLGATVDIDDGEEIELLAKYIIP